MSTTAAATRPPMIGASRISQAVRIATNDVTLFDQGKAEHGDTFSIRLAGADWTYFSDPEDVKRIFTSPATVLHAGKGNEILATALGDHSVLLLDEDEHMRQRKLLLPSFHGERLATQTAAMKRIAEVEVAKVPLGSTFSIRDLSQNIALEVILEVVLGTASTGAQHDRLGKATRELLDWISSSMRLLVSQVMGPRSRAIKRMYRPALEPLDNGLYELISERRREPDLESRDDILSMLLLARDDQDRPMTDVEIRDELVTLIVAGHETTATALAWSFERLTRTLDGAERLHEEAQTENTEYARWVAQEALRLRPVLDFVLRRVMEPIEVGGYQFQPGDVLAPSIYLIHRREDIYPDPLAFKPERWDGVKPGTYTWIPFGGGVRRCIGMQFAMAEMEIVMRAIARAGILLPVGPAEPVIGRFITSSPKRGGQVRFAF